MLTLEQLISEATTLSDADKAVLLEKIIESMAGQVDQNLLSVGIKQAQERLAQIDSGVVQTIPGDIALAQIRQRWEQ
jgi:Putative addiction module component